MGNREDLLAGARRVIVERGVANATARDIAQAAGVSLAAIGYHFGSKDQLVTEALLDTLGTGIGDGMEAAIVEAKDLPASPVSPPCGTACPTCSRPTARPCWPAWRTPCA